MKLSQIAAAGFAALTIGAASANPIVQAVLPGGDLGDNPVDVGFVALGTGTSTYSFDLVDSAPAGFFTSFDLKVQDLLSIFGAVTVNSLGVTGGTFSQTVVPNGSSNVTFTGLLAGSYTLKFVNTAVPSNPFLTPILAGKATAVGTVTPVPEAGSIAMAVAGLGVVGLIAARRRKA